jgi:Tfp pilus assembly protein PilV
LVELVIAMAILAVGLIGTMRVFPVGLRASQRAEKSSRATMVGQRTLELLKVTPCEAIAEGTQEVEGFTVTTRLSSPSQTKLVDSARLTSAEISVGWTLQSRPRSLTFVTYLRCPRVQQ